MATMHYFWMKFDCRPPGPPDEGKTAAASMASGGSKEITGGTVRSSGGGGSGGPQGTGTEVQGGTVRSGGGSGGGSGPQAGGGQGSSGGSVTLGGTVRSRAEVDTANTGLVSFNLLDARRGGIVGTGSVSFWCIPGQTAIRFPDEASALNLKTDPAFNGWVGNSVAVLTCIETP
jgi:hypothetical protein